MADTQTATGSEDSTLRAAFQKLVDDILQAAREQCKEEIAILRQEIRDQRQQSEKTVSNLLEVAEERIVSNLLEIAEMKDISLHPTVLIRGQREQNEKIVSTIMDAAEERMVAKLLERAEESMMAEFRKAAEGKDISRAPTVPTDDYTVVDSGSKMEKRRKRDFFATSFRQAGKRLLGRGRR